MLKAQGHEVTGCDTDLYPPMSDYVAKYGIPCAQGFSPEHLDPRPDLVVIGNAIHADNPEARAVWTRDSLRLHGGGHRPICGGGPGKFGGGRNSRQDHDHGPLRVSPASGGALPEHDRRRRGQGLRQLLSMGRRKMDGAGRDEYDTAFFDKGPSSLHYAPSLLIPGNIEVDHLDNFRTWASWRRPSCASSGP